MQSQRDKGALVVGLGNPGRKYAKTRHNLGFMVVEEFAKEQGIALREETKFVGRVGKAVVDGMPVHLLLPSTYMNESGLAVRKVVDYFGLVPGQVLVVCDDVELPFGTIRMRHKGGTGGHRGLQSVATSLGTKEYPRIRVGVGRSSGDLADYVLSHFLPKEHEQLKEVVGRAVEMVQEVMKESVIRETR